MNDNAQIFAESKKLREEAKNKKKENAKILMWKDSLENDVRKMQNETDELENVYKELLLLTNEMKVIKRNMVPCQALNEENDLQHISPRNRNDAASELSQEMVMDVPDDLGLAEGEQGDHYYESDVAM